MAEFFVQRLHRALRPKGGQRVLLNQGSIDRACGLYCIAMALVLLGEVSYEQAVKTLGSRQAALRRLKSWTAPAFAGGTSEDDLAEAVTAISSTISVSRGAAGEHRKCLGHALEGLRAGNIVALGIEAPGEAWHPATSCCVNPPLSLDRNPVTRVKKPQESRGRVRFLSDDERERLLAACKTSGNPLLFPAVTLALCTGARSPCIG